MKLFEFFGQLNFKKDHDDDKFSLSREEEESLEDSLFWYILEDDELHKKHFMPIAKKLKAKYDNHNDDSSKDWKEWLPMVNKGCIKYYKAHDVMGDPRDTFNKKLRKDLCKRIENHYRNDILNNEYNLGD